MILSAAYAFCGLFQGYLAIRLLFLVVFPPIAAALVYYLAGAYRDGEIRLLFVKDGKIPFLFVIIALLAALFPLLTHSFLFMDDLWYFDGSTVQNVIQLFIGFGRPLAGISAGFYSGISWSNSCIGRIISFVLILCYALLLYVWFQKFSKNNMLSLIMTVIVAGNFTIADMLGLILLFPMFFGLIFSAFSVMLFYHVYEKGKDLSKWQKLLFTLVSMLSLFYGFNHYAIATPIVFLFLAVIVYYEKWGKRLFYFFLKYAGLMVCAATLYYLSIYAFSSRYNIAGQIANRGALSFGVQMIIQKAEWFLFTVLPQCVYRVYCLFLGREIVITNNVYFSTGMRSHALTICLLILFAAILLVGFIRFYLRQRKVLPVVVLLAFIVFAFYPNLILPDSTYMSYYAYAVMALLLFYFISGIGEIGKLIRTKWNWARIRSAALPALCVICVLVCLNVNRYAQDFWVEYNMTGYTIAENAARDNLDEIKSSKWIHVIGTQSPVQSNTFPIYLVQHVLRNLGLNPAEYRITASSSSYCTVGLSTAEYKELLSSATAQEAAKLSGYYRKDPMYDLYWLNNYNIPKEDQTILEHAFNRAKQIPSSQDHAVFIDLSAFPQLARF